MKENIKEIFVFFVLLMSVNIMFCQYGWTKAEVFLKDGTVKVGEAYLPVQKINAITVSSNERLVYRLARKQKKARYKPEQVDSVLFYIDGRIDKYIPVYLNNKKKLQGFMQLMINGNVQLVGRTEEFASSGGIGEDDPNPWDIEIDDPELKNYFNHNRLMLIKDGDVLDRIKIKGFRVRGMEFFSECKTLVQKIETKDFTKDDFFEITQFYNSNCTN